MSSPHASSPQVVVLIGDVVGSRSVPDRAALHRRLIATLQELDHLPHRTALRLTNGDEFQGSFDHLGQALNVLWHLRLRLLPEVDTRYGLARGGVSLTGTPDGMEDGPAWWAARAAVEQARAQARHPGLRHTRALMVTPADHDPQEAYAVTAALRCQDHLVGSLDERSIHIVRGLIMGRTQAELAAELGISASAVSQRSAAHGLAALVASMSDQEQLR